jgi:Holliday junction DNA helicase RuvA
LTGAAASAEPSPVDPTNAVYQEAESALIALGYKPQDAARAISRIEQPVNSSAELIRLALKNMGK